jgi:hypothetical protein
MLGATVTAENCTGGGGTKIMPDWNALLTPQFTYAIIGAIFLIAAVVSVCTGTAISRSGCACRAKDPAQFWWTIAIGLFAGIFSIGIYLRSVFPETIFHPELWLQLK